MFNEMFGVILGLGLAIPCTGILILNLLVKAFNGDNYQLDLGGLGKVYLLALLGWSLFIGSL